MKPNNLVIAMQALCNELHNLSALIDDEPCSDSILKCFENLSTAFNLIFEVSDLYLEEK